MLLFRFDQGLLKNKKKIGKGNDHARVKELMKQTKCRRHNWIRQDPAPSIFVVRKYPHL